MPIAMPGVFVMSTMPVTTKRSVAAVPTKCVLVEFRAAATIAPIGPRNGINQNKTRAGLSWDPSHQVGLPTVRDEIASASNDPAINRWVIITATFQPCVKEPAGAIWL